MSSGSPSERITAEIERIEALWSNESRMIRVWRFRDASPDLQSLSEHAGDEDWIAVVPAEVWVANGRWISWAEIGTGFGSCDVSRYELPDGSVVLIGAHA